MKFNQTEQLIHHEFVRTAKKFTKKIAIIDKTTNQRVTYSRALLVSLLFAESFRKLEDEYVGVMLPNTAGAFLTIIGLLMARKVPVLINYSTGAENNCKFAQELCSFITIITSKGLLDKINCPLIPGMQMIEDFAATFTKIQKLKAMAFSKLPVRLLLNSFEKTEKDDTSTILFTSGSENNPKAVQLSHRNILANVADIREAFDITDKASFLSVLPLFHVFGLTTCFWTPVLTGCSVVTYANPLEFKTIPKIIKDEKVTLIAGTPSFFAGYLRESDKGDFQSVEIMVAGADKTPEWLRKAYMEKHNIELCEGYGTTETSPVISTNTPKSNRPGSIGKPVAGAQVKITDLETNATLPVGKEGKILVKGDLVMKGYFDDFEATSMRIRDGWYDTGDMGILDEDGYLWHRGRLKRFVKIGGEMVSMVRVESEVMKLLADDVECCVIEIPDPRKGARLAVVTTTEIKKEKIMKDLKNTLPAIAIPKIFVTLPELPKMGSGKIDFRSVTKAVRHNLMQH